MKISIIVPVYNAECYVEEAVESALKHSITGEVLLVEDFSTDNSFDVCLKLFQKYENVKLYRTEGKSNKGAAAARNIGLKNAIYDWILFFDADDVYIEKSLDSVNLSMIQSDAIFFYVQMKLIDSSQKLYAGYFSYSNGERIPSISLLPEISYNYIDFLKGASPAIFGLLFNRRVVTKIGNLDESLIQCQDMDWLLRLFWHCDVRFSGVQKSIVNYRIHGNNRVLNIDNMTKYNALFNLKWITLSLYNKLPLEVLLIFYKRYIGIHPLIYKKNNIPKRAKQLLITIELPFKILKYFLQNKEKVKETLKKNA